MKHAIGEDEGVTALSDPARGQCKAITKGHWLFTATAMNPTIEQWIRDVPGANGGASKWGVPATRKSQSLWMVYISNRWQERGPSHLSHHP